MGGDSSKERCSRGQKKLEFLWDPSPSPRRPPFFFQARQPCATFGDEIFSRAISIFEEEVTEHFTIKNKTEEKYFGEEDGKDYGKCFLGKIIDITDLSSNESILSDLESYSFSVINLSEEIAPGTMVRVSHLRIAPSYTLGSLKILQVICSKIRARINKKMKEFAQHAK